MYELGSREGIAKNGKLILGVGRLGGTWIELLEEMREENGKNNVNESINE